MHLWQYRHAVIWHAPAACVFQKWEKILDYILLLFRISLSLSLSLSLSFFSTWVCICVWLLLIRKCVLVFNLYTASSACVRKGNVLGFVSVYIRTHNIILHLLLSSSSFSVYPKKVPCSSFFVSARHPIDTFAIQQKKYFYYSHILHLGSWILLAFDKWFEKFRILLKIYKPFLIKWCKNYKVKFIHSSNTFYVFRTNEYFNIKDLWVKFVIWIWTLKNYRFIS